MVDTFVSISLEEECDICCLATDEPLVSCDLCLHPPLLNITQGFNRIAEPVHTNLTAHAVCFQKAHQVLKQNNLHISPAFKRKSVSMPNSPRLIHGNTLTQPDDNMPGSPKLEQISYFRTYSVPNSPRMGLQTRTYMKRTTSETGGSRTSLKPEDALIGGNKSSSLTSLSSCTSDTSKKRSCCEEPRYSWSPSNGRKHICGSGGGLGCLTPEGSMIGDSHETECEQNEKGVVETSYSMISLRNGGRSDTSESKCEGSSSRENSMASCKTGPSRGVRINLLGRLGSNISGGSIVNRYRRFSGGSPASSCKGCSNERGGPDRLAPLAGPDSGEGHRGMAMEEAASCAHDKDRDENNHTSVPSSQHQCIRSSSCDNPCGDNDSGSHTRVAQNRRPVSMYNVLHSGLPTWDRKTDQLLRSKVMSSRTWCDCSQDFITKKRNRAMRTRSCVLSESSRLQDLNCEFNMRRHSHGDMNIKSDKVERTLSPVKSPTEEEKPDKDNSKTVSPGIDLSLSSKGTLSQTDYEENSKNTDTSADTSTSKDDAERENCRTTETTPGGLVLTDAMKYTRDKLLHRCKEDLVTLLEHFYKQIQNVSEELVELLQERHDLQEQVEMRRIAIEQLVRLQNESPKVEPPSVQMSVIRPSQAQEVNKR